ncbi:UNVERIFIED_CONTAM: hypothetical protein Sradi_2010300 [Sesamum radiatum]|uniref:Reverse transcriptase zinc-binding domain-containing protein n=1 Tax=Sesamum radiatum TaxID=300843 RepID=A0AAW2TGS7_SESRA
MRERNVASSSTKELSLGSHSDSLWKIVWDTKVPPRIRVFIWRLCREVLPTLENIGRQKRGIDVCCAMCGMQVESSKHIFLECSFARCGPYHVYPGELYPLGMKDQQNGFFTLGRM